MGRPKKKDMNPVPTGERLLKKGMELFARKGYDAVSIRDITRALSLNEATLYIYYKNKAALLEAIFKRLENRLINPGLTVPPLAMFEEMEDFNLAGFLLTGAKRFFNKADQETLLTWRILMTSQYRNESARRSVQTRLLDGAVEFFTAMLKTIQTAGKLKAQADCDSLGRIIATLFFDYSFRTNLNAAWNKNSEEELAHLEKDLHFVVTCYSV